MFVGRISYGLYLWHYPLALLVRQHLGVAGLPVTLVVSFILAVVSWYLIERPFMRHGTQAARKGTEEKTNLRADPQSVG